MEQNAGNAVGFVFSKFFESVGSTSRKSFSNTVGVLGKLVAVAVLPAITEQSSPTLNVSFSRAAHSNSKVSLEMAKEGRVVIKYADGNKVEKVIRTRCRRPVSSIFEEDEEWETLFVGVMAMRLMAAIFIQLAAKKGSPATPPQNNTIIPVQPTADIHISILHADD